MKAHVLYAVSLLLAGGQLAAQEGVPLALPQTQATEPRQYPRTERRVFEVRSQDAWPVVQTRLAELGLQVDKIDKKNQALLTKWRRFSTGGWLPDPQLPAPYSAEQIRFVVFVSPFVDPAHISVGSQMEAMKPFRTPATVYNVSNANRALMAEIDKALAAASLLRFVRDQPDPCAGPRGPDPIFQKPVTIPLSVFEPRYPGPDLKARTSGNVVVDMIALKDGGVSHLRVASAPVGEQLEASAAGAASLLLFSPVRLDGCPSTWIIRQPVKFVR